MGNLTTPEIIHGDCVEVMRGMEPDSVDAIVTDPPYGLSFMNAKWDYDVPSVEVWREALRVLKPGGHLLAFAGTRTHHRMCVNIEDGGFEIRDMIGWLYGSGFPKSLDVGKAIDKAAGVEREVIGKYRSPENTSGESPRKQEVYSDGLGGLANITAPATKAARQWDGWGTALKPAFEPITLARKPLTGTVAANVLEHGTGGLNVDECRVGIGDDVPGGGRSFGACEGVNEGWKRPSHADYEGKPPHNKGRFPANIIHDGSDEVLEVFPDSVSTGGDGYKNSMFCGGKKTGGHGLGDSGSAARFFYCAKTSQEERNRGLEARQAVTVNDGRKTEIDNPFQRGETARRNTHSTVKPVDLMRYLCRLVTPPGGVVLDPFVGSGSTLIAAHEEGFGGIGIEINPEYCEIARSRIDEATRQGRLF